MKSAAWIQGSFFESACSTYPRISSIWAPIDLYGATFGTNSAKNSTIVLGIPLFEARLAIGGYFAAENDR
jgi:hypothetical protein